MGDSGVQLVKARNDKRDYRPLILSNELRVLLISDPETDKAAAAMDVNVGSYSDPKELPGLAHFLEHMLFYSSEKYPLEDDYNKFLTEHGGRSNACTNAENTTYFFDVNAEHLDNALDRFAQFFICPLMSADATSREINAVNSENSKNLTVDRWRLDQLSRHLSSTSHPYHMFGTGSLETLDVLPKANHIDTREELVKFHKAHYSSSLMCLSVYGKESLDELEKMVEDKFKAIKSTSRKPPHFPGQPFLPEHMQIMVKAVAIKATPTLEMMWSIVSDIMNYKAAPCRYLGHLIGHESEGSLFSLLKTLGWANSLSAGETDRSRDLSYFVVQIELTDAGQEHVEEIVSMTFQYINLIRENGIAKWIFDEIRTIGEMKFHYQDNGQPMHYVTRVAGSMQLYPVEDWLIGPAFPVLFDEKSIREVLDLLVPERVRVFWASKAFEGKTTDTEPWYGTFYSLETISASTINNWKNGPLDPRLHLPTANPFIPTDFSLRLPATKEKLPVLLKTTHMSKLWFKPDRTFKTPKACIILNASCPESSYSPEAAVLSTLFTKLLMDCLNEYGYHAEVAGLQYNVQRTSNGFNISVAGYNDKLSVLLVKIMEKMVNFEMEEDRFAIVKEKQLRDYINFNFQQPYQQAIYFCAMLLEHRRWHISDLIEALSALQAQDLKSFIPRLLSRIHLECYAGGNMASSEAESLIEKVEDLFRNGGLVKAKPPLNSQMVEERILQLEPCELRYPVPGLNPENENSAVDIYFQIGEDKTELNVLLELLVLTAKQQVFHQLRTVEQLGYIVSLLPRKDANIRGVQFLVQSSIKDCKAIDSRVEGFLQYLETYLEDLTDEEFRRNVAALIDNKLEKHKNIWEEMNVYWKEIEVGSLKFDRQYVEAEALKSVTKEQLVSFFAEHIKAGSPMRRKLSVQMHGKLFPMGELDAEVIKDIYTFKRSQRLYHSAKNGT